MPPLTPGTVLQNRYRISKVLYQSKLTNVYAVDDIHIVGNIWALKEMKFLAMDKLERQNMLDQFQREFLRLCSLSHPNIAHFIDYFVEGRNLYILREFIPAYAIKELMERAGGVRERDTLFWGAQLADVIHYLYKKKFSAVFFRELSILNILINVDGNVKLVDLGLATIFQTETNPERLQNIGSMDYASPELFDENGFFDERSLVYSIGAILFHILTNQNPAQNPFNLPPIEEFNPNISPATRNIIKKATNNNPDQRYQSLADFRGAVEKILKNKTYVQSEPAAKKERLKEMPEKKARDHKRDEINSLSYILILIIMLLSGGIVFLVYKFFF